MTPPLQIKPCGTAPGTTHPEETLLERGLFWFGMIILAIAAAGALLLMAIGFARCCL